jgi:hypothetical protein
LGRLGFAEPLARFVHGDGHQPGAELGVTAKTFQMPKGVDHHFLRGVLRFLLIAQHGEDGEIHHPLIRANEFVEKVGFARKDPGDKLLFPFERGRHACAQGSLRRHL